MQGFMTYDQCLSGLMKKHRITISDMTRRLKIKSNTTLSRVLHAQCSTQAIENFHQMLLEATPPLFNAAEFKYLEASLEVTRIGVAAYCANQEMWQLLEDQTTPSTPFPIESYGNARFTSTTELREFLKTVKSATIHIACSLVYPLFSEVRDLIVDLAPAENVQVHHYFSLEGDESQIIRAIRTALPALRLANYHGYKMTRPSTLDKEFLSQNHAIANFERADGTFGSQLIAFVANRCLLYENDEKTGMYYLHLFSPKQPDLNWENEAVRNEVFEMMDWWCRKGIDGFRMDVISMISKTPSLPDGEVKEGLYGDFSPYAVHGPKVHTYLKEMNKKVY